MIIASNFKTNHTRKSTHHYIKELSSFIDDKNIKEDIFIFPTALSIDNFDKNSHITIGVQNAYPTQKGSFTGELGLEQLEEFDIKTILIGHSERRHLLLESDKLILEKYNFYKENNFKIIYCIGEPKEVREQGIESVVEYNLTQLEGIDLNYENLIVAYEPVWAIGTGLTASKEQIEETLDRLRQSIKAPLLYGGSVKVQNTKEILSIKNCDGILVGTASWDVENFKKMVEIADEL